MPVDVYVLQLCAQQISLRTNDLASSEYASLLFLAIPCIVARVIERKNGNNAGSQVLERIAYLRTSLFLDRHTAPADWKQARLKQQRFVRAQDQQSRRCGPLYGKPAPASQYCFDFQCPIFTHPSLTQRHSIMERCIARPLLKICLAQTVNHFWREWLRCSPSFICFFSPQIESLDFESDDAFSIEYASGLCDRYCLG